MNVRQAMPGAWEITPVQHGSSYRMFMELCRFADLDAVAGESTTPAQASLAVSIRGAVRGVHYTARQVKLVTCVAGAVRDVVVDLRAGSPNFGRWAAVDLDDVDRRAVLISAGMGHGYCVLSERATLLYLVSAAYDPDAERGINPFDPELAIDWPTDSPDLSARDIAAPNLAQAFGVPTIHSEVPS